MVLQSHNKYWESGSYLPLLTGDTMTISKDKIESKKTELSESFKILSDRIVQMEKELGKLRSDANAVSGAIQVCDQLLNEADTKEMPEEKAQALNMATS